MARGIRRLAALVTGIALVGGALTGTAVAQGATPVGSPGAGSAAPVEVTLRDKDGKNVGTATLTAGTSGQVTVAVQVTGLTPGKHGIHIHEHGVCDPTGSEPFKSAGKHFNPTGAKHGPPMMGHAGDLGNITIDSSGTGLLATTSDRITLRAGAKNSLQHAGGTALIIHAKEDDLKTEPTGNSGGRIACGVIFPASGTPTAGTPTT